MQVPHSPNPPPTGLYGVQILHPVDSVKPALVQVTWTWMDVGTGVDSEMLPWSQESENYQVEPF